MTVASNLAPERTTARIGLRLLGRPAVLVDGVAERRLPRKVEALLFLLAVSNRSWSRTDIAELLWDDRGGTGRQSLRVALTKIPEPINAILLRTPEQLALAETDSDLAGWRAHCASVRPLVGAGDLDGLDARLVELSAWPGGLLEGLEIDAPAFDDWCYAERQRVQREWQTAVVDAVTHLAGAGRWAAAEPALTRLLEVDAAHETAHRWLIQCYLETGRPEAARSQYDLCKRTLATQLGVQPDPSLQALLHSAGRPAAPAPASESQPSRHGSPRTDNLPRQLNSFVGRQTVMNDVRRILQEHRLVTLFGAGGIGKTRLATQVGASLLDHYPDGVWLADLTAASRDAAVPQVLALALAVAEEPGRPLVEAIERHLRGRHLLVILDNCEHVIAGAADLAHRLLQAGPNVSVLATSREWLHIAGEATFDVPALDLPASTGREPIRTLEDIDAIRLFVDRARAARSDFRLNDANAASVIDICRRLDGIPLALELAAARVRSLPVDAIAAHLQNRFQLPGTGDRNRLPRQQTLEALIDWSYQLLDADEARVFRRLAIFAHGWTLAAAGAVVADDEIAPERVVELLGNLVEKSLVVLDADTSRYRMLETIRHFGRQRLDGSGEADALRCRHVEYFLTLAETARPHLAGPEQAEWLARLDDDRENLLAAFARSAHMGDSADLGARLVHALRPYWINRGLMTTGIKAVLEVLRRPSMALANERRCKVLFGAGQISLFMESCSEAVSYLSEALAIARQTNNLIWVAGILQPLGMAQYGQGDYAAADRSLAEAVELARSQGDAREIVGSYNALAQLYRLRGDLVEALELYKSALVIARKLADGEAIAILLLNISMVSIDIGEKGLAFESLREAYAISCTTGSSPVQQGILDVSVGLAAACLDWANSARFFGAAEAQVLRTGLTRDATDARFLEPWTSRAVQTLGPEAFAQAEAMGRQLTFASALQDVDVWLRTNR